MRTRHTALALVFATVSAVTLAAQQGDSPTQGLVRKNKVPVSNDVVKVTLPKPVQADLPNGLHLMVLEDHRTPQVSFQLFIPGAGGYADPADRSGLATFTADLLREGTTTRSSNDIAQQLEVMAATLTENAATASLEAVVAGSALSDQFEKLMDLAADVLLHPAFAAQEVARYKDRTRAALVQQRANPNFVAAEVFARAIYGVHPAARRSPAIASLDAVTRDEIVAFHRTHYVPDHAAIAIAGDITMAEARRLVTARLGGWQKAGTAAATSQQPETLNGPKIYFVARPNSVQTSLIVGAQGIERGDSDYIPLQVMNRVLGAGPTGRLFIHLREEKGYTYGAYSAVTALRHRGDWQAATNVRTEVTEPALRDLLADIVLMRDQALTDQELADAKREMIASFALSLESPATLIGYYITNWRYNLPADYWDRYADRVNTVTKADVQAIARRYLAAERLQIVAVGDPTRVAEPLKRLGTVETFDTDGKPVAEAR